MDLQPPQGEVHAILNQIAQRQELIIGAVLFERIGRGACGTVYKATEDCTGKTIAVKIVKFETEDDKEKALKEARIHINLNHRNIVKLYKYYIKETFLIMHMEYFDGEDLINFILHGSVKGQQHCIKKTITQDLKSVLGYLHRQDLGHGDIHYSNVMVNGNGELKLIDFGSAGYDTFKIAYDRERAQSLYEDIEEVMPFKRL